MSEKGGVTYLASTKRGDQVVANFEFQAPLEFKGGQCEGYSLTYSRIIIDLDGDYLSPDVRGQYALAAYEVQSLLSPEALAVEQAIADKLCRRRAEIKVKNLQSFASVQTSRL
ncbi:MAG: hypothetical protein P4M13_08150 [Alphaproteobacteria bacterium]|nr:hypothetical protein [Alphaproteobacteria bacterium]